MAANQTVSRCMIALLVAMFIASVIVGGLMFEGLEGFYKMAAKFPLEITLAKGAYYFTVVSLIYQIAYVLYIISTAFRASSGALDVLSTRFFVYLTLNYACAILWTVLYIKQYIVGSFIVVIVLQIFFDLAFYTAVTDYHGNSSNLGKADEWCQLLLVQNGLLFYGTWTTFMTLYNTATMLTYSLDVNSQTSSIIALILLGVLLIGWFVMESVAVCGYTTFTFTAYIAMIWIHSGIHANIWGKNEAVAILNLILLVLAVILLVVRLILIYLKQAKKASYENIGYDAQQEEVRS